MNNNITNQMELTLSSTNSIRPGDRQCGSHRPSASGAATGPDRRRQQTRIERAAWWFGKMRATVDNAMSWKAQPTQPQQHNQPALV